MTCPHTRLCLGARRAGYLAPVNPRVTGIRLFLQAEGLRSKGLRPKDGPKLFSLNKIQIAPCGIYDGHGGGGDQG